jgi:hypothetical protein
MRRVLVALALLLAPFSAWANSYDALIAGDTYLEHYWNGTSTSDSKGSATLSCTGSCSYSQPLATLVSGFTTTGYLSVSATFYSGANPGPAFTLEWWEKGTDASAANLVSIGSSLSGTINADCCGRYSQAGRVYAYLNASVEPGDEWTSATTYNNGSAHHFVMACSAQSGGGTGDGNCNLYADGVLQTTGYSLTYDGRNSADPATIYIGGLSGPAEVWTGAIGGVAYYVGEQMSQSEVTAHYKCGTGTCSSAAGSAGDDNGSLIQ